jgi:hypothetical protein
MNRLSEAPGQTDRSNYAFTPLRLGQGGAA